ncbi:hypothetical protein TorRG33x02_300080 [Trema orientale]|uniref:Uncharacterized protein n=1 Tax=Trema orientale TaxID=63057 RepID=A0A2P5C2E6_TREOI|nr:hypothetical protein TorRG33x02_300080 [Trema orientale]
MAEQEPGSLIEKILAKIHEDYSSSSSESDDDMPPKVEAVFSREIPVHNGNQTETGFINSNIHTASNGNENTDVPAEDSKTPPNNTVMPTTSEVEYFIQNYMRAMSAALSNHANMTVPVQSLQTQPNNMGTTLEATTSFVKNIYTIFKKDENMDVPICIFKVPNSLASSKPEAYVPQLLGLGPYHHLRPELQQMQTYKLSEVKRICKAFENNKFELLVLVLREIVGPSARACYDMYLDMDDEVLACILAIDGLFLFELLCCYGISKDALGHLDLLHLVNSAGRRLARDTTLRDVMMVENQVPILVLKVILITLEMFASQEEKMEPIELIVSDPFPRMLLGFCNALSPLKVLIDYPQYKVLKHAHLLDLMYHLIILNDSPARNPDEELEEARFIEEITEKVKNEISKVKRTSKLKSKCSHQNSLMQTKMFEETLDLLPEELKKPIKFLQGLRGLPWS